MAGNLTETEKWTDWLRDERRWKLASDEKQTGLTVDVQRL